MRIPGALTFRTNYIIPFKGDKPLFTEHKRELFPDLNYPEPLGIILSPVTQEYSEIDYMKFIKDLKRIENRDFDGDYNVLTDIPVPGISDKYRVCFDIYMIGWAHLLVVPKENRRSFADCQEKDKEELEKTVRAVKNMLNKMFIGGRIYYAEHGSGINEDKKQEHAGTSLSTAHAHGHFFVSFRKQQPNFDIGLIQGLDYTLETQGWGDIEKNSYTSDKVIPDYQKMYKEVSKKTGKNIQDFPYLHIGIFENDGSEKSKIYVKTLPEYKVPSQILRKLYYHMLDPNPIKDDLGWDWKKAKALMDKYGNKPIKLKLDGKDEISQDELNAMAVKLSSTFRKGQMVRFWTRFLELKDKNEL